MSEMRISTEELRKSGQLVRQEKRKLQKSLFRLDLVLFTACGIVGLDTLAFISSAGGQSMTWLVLSVVLFLIPYGLATAELGAAFPVEGGPYEWTRMAFGRLAGAVTSVLYWISNPIWVGGSITATGIAALNTFVLSKPMSKWVEIVFGLAFVWTTVGIAIIALKYGKWLLNIGMMVKVLLTLAFIILGIAFLVSHGRPHGTVSLVDLKPTVTGFLFLVGVIAFSWTGFELATSASEEMMNPQKDVPKMVAGSGVLSGALYVMFVLFTLLVIPKSRLTNVSSFTDAYSRVATVLGSAAGWFGYLVAVLVLLALLMSGAAWIVGCDRTQAVAALSGAAPAWMGKFTSFGTPIAVNISSGVVGSSFVFFVFLFSTGKLSQFFAVVLPLIVSTFTLSYIFVFLALPILRMKYPDVARPYRIPGGLIGTWVCAILIEVFVVLTGITLLWPGLIDGLLGHSYSIQANFGVSRVYFETVTLVSFGLFVGIGIVFWFIGKRSRKRGLTGEPDLVLGASAEAQGITE